jgi:cephalosporin-C deacetylase-like acetyl esterase
VQAVRIPICLALAALVAGCGSSHARPARGIPTLSFGYDAAAPLRYVDRGVVAHGHGVAVHDVSFASQGIRVDGYLVAPSSTARRRPAVVVVHGSGGDRSELLSQAEHLAVTRRIVALTITEPSTSHPPGRAATVGAFLRQTRATQVRDVVAVRRAVDVLRSLPQVDAGRIGYLGWSAGAKNGAFVASSEPRVKALALLSAGADPLASFVAHAPPGTKASVRRILGSVDPLRYIARARPGSVLLVDGTRDEIVPHEALLNVVHAAPRGTTVRWFPAPHALDRAAWDAAFAWLARKLEG